MNLFLVWWLRGARYRWSRLRRRLFEGRYLSMELPMPGSLDEVEACLKQVTWSQDGPWHLYDSISYPQTVWAKKQDDCDGFAILATELLRRWSPDTSPVLVTAIVTPVRLSHTVCAFRQDNTLSFFDNDKLRKGGFKSYEDIVAWFTSNTSGVICWDVVEPDSLQTLEFHSP